MIIEIGGKKYEVAYTEEPYEITFMCATCKPKWANYDTETTGLHLKKDRPFLGAIAWDGFVFVFPTTEKLLRVIKLISMNVERIYCHNTVFDMNMTANITGDAEVLEIKNWGDTAGLCRLCFEAISARDGGDRLKLKMLGKKYVDPHADKYEAAVKEWLRHKKAADRKILIAMLRGEHVWTMKRFEAALNDGVEPIPEEVMDTFRLWRNEYPEPCYKDVPMEIMLPYVAVDTILCNELVHKSLPVIAHKSQTKVMEDEFNVIPIVFKMSRIGIKVDREYLMKSGELLDAYIEELEKKMFILTNGQEISVNQHAKLKEFYGDLLGFVPESTDKKFMKGRKAEGDKLAEVIIKLRTLEKWKSTYIDRILEATEYDGRFYTALDQFNPVSGRFSGDLQQQPKKPIQYEYIEVDGYDELPPFSDGEELFHPRKAFLADADEGYKMFFMDFSQVELRVQAHYTLAFGGDLHMCQAYMPFKCYHYKTGQWFNYDNYEDLMRWNEKQEDGETSAWIVPEGTVPWTPTDIHSTSTKKALTLLGIDWKALTEKEFKAWRNIGKTFNFMRNYGGGAKKASEVLGITLEEGKAMAEGFTQAFPLVITYQKAVEAAFYKKGYVEGIYGRRYYLSDSWRFYKGANYLVQGSCAHDLKLKMVELDKLLTGTRSYMVMTIHDEVLYRIHESELYLVPQLKAIMEYTPKVRIPIVSEVDYTETNWGEKHSWNPAA